MIHIDDFIDDYNTDAYASWFFLLHRLPATLQIKFKKQIEEYQLYCDYEGVRYRVTGASRMGDIWLTSNFNQNIGYEKRVDISKCTGFSDKP